jgi:hypothetical protein
MGTINHQEVIKLKISAKITTTIGAAAIFAMLAVPAMANTTTHASFLAGNGPGNGTSDILLLARGGNGNGEGGKGSDSGSGDHDGSGSGDRDRDGSCLDSITAPNAAAPIVLAGNGNGSGDHDGDKDQDRDASCQV